MLLQDVPAEPLIESLPVLRLAPPFIAIGLAILLKDVNFALLLAVFGGCLIASNLDVLAGFDALCEVLVGQIADKDHSSVILFTVLLGAMIGLMNDSGGTRAVIDRLTRFADTRKRGQVLTWFSGLIVFFDDYANTMLIGGAMRPLCDRLRISRAKLAFLIDATAAPVAGLLLSTWTAFEIDQVQAGLHSAQIDAQAGRVFFETIPYRLYPIAAIAAVAAVAFSGKDVGTMLTAERRAASEPSVESSEQGPEVGNIWFAILPVLTLCVVVGIGLYREGLDIDAYGWLLAASLAASTMAAAFPILCRRMTIRKCSESWTAGITAMIPAIVVLVLAWAVSAVCREGQLDTAGYIISLIGDAVSPEFLPAIAFLAAGAISVSIGSSFTTMALLVPMFIPLCWGILSGGEIESVEPNHPIFLATIGAILAGAIFGDHCSPISDTTVLSSAAAGCDHLEHVATQLPYALLIALCSLIFGYLPIGFGVPWWLALPLSTLSCVCAIVFLGQDASKDPAQTNPAENS